MLWFKNPPKTIRLINLLKGKVSSLVYSLLVNPCWLPVAIAPQTIFLMNYQRMFPGYQVAVLEHILSPLWWLRQNFLLNGILSLHKFSISSSNSANYFCIIRCNASEPNAWNSFQQSGHFLPLKNVCPRGGVKVAEK